MSITDTRMEYPAGQVGHRRRKSCQMGIIDATNISKSKIIGTRQQNNYRSHGRSKMETDATDLEQLLLEDGTKNEDLVMNYLSDDGLHYDEEVGPVDKGKKKKKIMRSRRRNTLLDTRIGATKTQAVNVMKYHVLRKLIVNGILIALWYTFSLFISIYNKWMFDPTHLDFHFPLFTTCLHMIVQFILSFLVLSLMPQFRPRRDSNIHKITKTATNLDEIPPVHEESWISLMTLKYYLTHIGPCGIATGLDIGLGNMSLKFISLTFYTMCKSSSLAFILFFAFLFRLEPPSIRLVLIIAVMTLGVLMMVAGETKFSPLGFILVIMAAFFSGFRWGLTQILLLTNSATSNPFSSIFFLAPVMFLGLFLLAIPIEGPSNLLAGLQLLIEKSGPILGPLLLLFPGIIAFCMTASEFALLQRTSVVTLSIAGIFKEIVTITSAGLVFQDQLTPINILGLFITLIAIIAYNFIKIRQMHCQAQEEAPEVRTSESDTDKSDYTYDADAEVENSDDDLEVANGIGVSELLLKGSKTTKHN
ncbi:putative transporter C22E12.01 [Erysiphe neolycopersici]|uniref:Putative transporter C22E12.01 n=1 Tax=Erysiphe neolycopersici TaxID=212602 RepID=A0A420HV06_9PEZI|nr:putative transporter C22E12.01 [Erysiphe neolycopersici]